MIKRFSITIYLLSFYGLLFSQAVRVQVISGANISTTFNSIAKYKAGITLSPYTTVGISVDEGVWDYKSWVLTINAEDLDGDGFFSCNNLAVNKVPFDVVEVSTNITLGCGECQEFFNPLKWKLTNAPQPLIDGNKSGGLDDISGLFVPPYPYGFLSDQFTISYFIGVPPNTSMFGIGPDFYSDAIVLTLTMTDP